MKKFVATGIKPTTSLSWANAVTVKLSSQVKTILKTVPKVQKDLKLASYELASFVIVQF